MDELSLAGELLWMAVDPDGRGLLPHGKRHRLRGSLAVAAGDGVSGLRAGRAARRELIDAGLVSPALLLRRLKLTDRPAAVLRFKEVWAALEANDPSDPRIRDLAVLLGASGVLAERLTREERVVAYRRLRHIMEPGENGAWQPTITNPVGAAIQVGGQLGGWLLASLGAGLLSHHHGQSGSQGSGTQYGGGAGGGGGGGGGGPTWGSG